TVIDNAAGVADQIPTCIMKRNSNPIFHETFGAKSQTKLLDRVRSESPVWKVGMILIEMLELKIERRIHDHLLSACRLGLPAYLWLFLSRRFRRYPCRTRRRVSL